MRSNSLQTAAASPVAPTDKPRAKALEILRDAEEGKFADVLLDRSRPLFDSRDNAFILELVYGTLRNQALLDWTLNQFSVQPIAKTDAWTRNILRLGAYQMLFLDRVPKSAAVNTAAELSKAYGKKSGYVNGLLRNLDRKQGSITYPGPEDPIKRLSVFYSHPEWLVKRWVERFGIERTETLLQKNNVPAPLIVRTNVLKTTRLGLKASLEREGAHVLETAYSTIGLQLISSPSLPLLTSYQQGCFIVQDQAAQLVSMMLSPQPGETVLDACAAPGGKATHLAEIMENRGTVVALERDPARIGSIIENSSRLGITIIQTVQGDATQYCEGLFDRILIDAPCSGLGVLRRHPDGRWTKSVKTIRGKKDVQKRILENCSRLLKPGGVLVYATCTTEPEENEDVINDFLAHNPAFALDDPRPYLPDSAGKLVDVNGFYRTMPEEPELDGFFGARLVKKS